ncbi:hypothetical protein [Chromohalobacter sp. 296-RDG]|uniref:hypothetical protein n=1 Tax=Chromohalobacter sp. 296-RDG TaxID=2994062 RepID=UPI0024694629|nr:hypothetical protein [Chromohalobacter sp. 296-RDG]
MSEQSQILIYEDAEKAVDVRLDEGRETVWLTQRQMGEVFETTPESVLMHLKNIFSDEELAEEATTKDFLVVRQEGHRQVRRKIQHYNLNAIISVGNLDQSVFGEPAYPSIKSKAAYLLYFVINDVGLAALTLLVAESDPANKETMIRLIMNMLADDTSPA